MKTTKIIAGLIVSALVSTTGVFAANTTSTSTGMAMPTTAKVAHTKKVVKKTTLTAAQKTAMAAKIAAKKTTKKVTTKKVVKKTTKKVASVKK
jgi:Spy/CpxP family protein refolding chaperone